MTQELESLGKSGTWQLIESKKIQVVLPGHWVYKFKTDRNVQVEKHEERYFAEGTNLRERVDYFKTFTPTSKHETFRMFLSLASKKKLTLRQFDVKSAYLHLKVYEKLSLDQLKGFEVVDETGHSFVCRLNKSFYGLKQAANN